MLLSLRPGVLGRDPLIHLEEVSIFLPDDRFTVSFNGVSEVKVYGITGGTDAHSLVAYLFCIARRHIPRDEVAETGIFSFQIIIPIRFGYLVGRALVAGRFGDPDATVVSETLTHKRQFGLIASVNRNTGGVYLDKGGVGKTGPFFIRPPDGGTI